MRWEELTSTEFKKAVEETGICVIAMGVIEKHSEHLPLGTDYLNGHAIAVRAAEKEPAIVFPPFYFGQIYEARCFPGTLTIKPILLLELIQEIFNEISRNGIKKILIYNAHGGNTPLVRFLAQIELAERKDYAVYVVSEPLSPERKKQWEEILDVRWGGHAHESETSISLANHQHIVKMNAVPEEPAAPLNRLKHLPGIFTGVSWYADFPDHYSGDARNATKEKGEKLRTLLVDSLAEHIAAVKKDEVVPALFNEFYNKDHH